MALALPIAQGLEAPLAITAAAVLLQGILGANFGPGIMTAVRTNLEHLCRSNDCAGLIIHRHRFTLSVLYMC